MTDEKKKRGRKAVARELAEGFADAEIERVEKMSRAAIVKELEDAGVDLAAEREHLRTMLAKRGIELPSKVVPITAAKKKSGAARTWIAVAIAAAVLVAIAWQMSKREVEPKRDVALPEPSTMPAPSQTSKPAFGCRPLAWRDGGLTAADVAFDGTIMTASIPGSKGGGVTFLTLSLDEPVCADDGAPVREMQILEAAGAGLDLGALVGRRVTLEGEPTAEQTSGHYTRVVLVAKKARPAPR